MWRREAPAPRRVEFADLRSGEGAALRRGLAGSAQDVARWLEAASRYGLVEAQVLYGQILLDGRGVERDPAAAFGWFRTAAVAGHPPGMNMAGRCLERAWGVAADLRAAAEWYRRAAEASLDWAQYNLGNMLLRGRGVPRDRSQALFWFLRAAWQGHAKSMNLVGRFLEEGWETPVDHATALAWYRQSAERGDFRGQFNLGTLLVAQGRDVEAMTWFARAARDGTPEFLAAMAQWLRMQADPQLRAMAARIVECRATDIDTVSDQSEQ